MKNMIKYIPKVTKRALLFLFALAWMLCSFFMIANSIANVFNDNYALLVRISICVPAGLLIYFFIFRRFIVVPYLDRIINMDNESPFIFSFMGRKSYTVFFVMASLSFCIEIYKLITLDYLFTFQSIMSIPILFTSLYFFKAWKNYEEVSTEF